MILAAGGIGSRVGASLPKQFLPLSGKPIALYSFDLFCQMDEIDEIVVVCEPKYRFYFSSQEKPVLFADPGKRRQDSILNGFLRASKKAKILCTHDSARPFIEKKELLTLLEKAAEMGAATLAAPVICTIKKCDANGRVEKTLDRSRLWEIQTPQAIQRDLFERGFSYVLENCLEITDDTSLAELLGAEVAIVASPHRNFKITTPTDMAVAKILCESPCAIS